MHLRETRLLVYTANFRYCKLLWIGLCAALAANRELFKKVANVRDPEFEQSEYFDRCRRAWAAMRRHGLAALLVCGESNYRYFTGHRTQFFVSKSRPLYALLPLDRMPIAIVAEIEIAVIQRTSWLRDIRSWLGFADDSLPLLVEVLRETGLLGERIGIDYGEEMRLGIPLTTFRKLEELVQGTYFVDGSPALWEVRRIKSSAEIDFIRRSCLASAAGFEAGTRATRAGSTERELHRRMAIGMLEAGADHVNWLPVHSGAGNYANFTMEPTDRVLEVGDMVWADAGTTVHGYYSDFNRIWAVGRASDQQRNAYRRIWDVTRACIDVVRPGIPIADIVRVRDDAYHRMGFAETRSRSGRMGHCSGLDITEPPTVALSEPTILEPGLVIHIEPKIIHSFGFFQLEEVVAVTSQGYTYLSPPAPANLPVHGT
jgi:Xaa-Pro dipeptidase